MELLFFFQLRHFSTVRMTARTVRGEVRSNGEAQCAHARFDSQSPRASVPFEPTVALEPIRRSGPRERPKVREVPLLPHSFVRQIGLAPMLRAARQRQRRPAARKTAPRARSRAAFGRDICAECGSSSQDDDDSAGAGSGAGVSMIGGGGGGAGTAAESAATWTAVVRLISSFRSFQEATLPAAKPSAQDERRAVMLAICYS